MFNGDDFPFRAMGQMHRQMMEDMDMMMGGIMGGPSFGGPPFGGPPFGGPFGGMIGGFGRPPPFSAITDGTGMRPSARHQQLARDPFGGFGGIFGAMHHLSERAMNDPSSHVFSQQTVMTFGPDGRPHVVENTMRKSGDVKETRKKVQNGEESSFSIGHTIGDRTHVIEKKRDKDGNVRKQQKFVNLDESGAEDFDREFSSRIRHNFGGGRGGYESSARRLLDNGERSGGRSSYSPSSLRSAPRGSAPIITLPDEEDEEETPRSRSRSSRNTGGPVIREISDEEAEQSIPKRRRGLFGGYRAE